MSKLSSSIKLTLLQIPQKVVEAVTVALVQVPAQTIQGKKFMRLWRTLKLFKSRKLKPLIRRKAMKVAKEVLINPISNLLKQKVLKKL